MRNFPSVNLNKVDEWRIRRVYVTYFRDSRAVTISFNFEISLANALLNHEYLNERLYAHFVEDPDHEFSLWHARVEESTVTIRIAVQHGMIGAFRRGEPIRIASKRTGSSRIIENYEYKAV
jgi:hypothetical protein